VSNYAVGAADVVVVVVADALVVVAAVAVATVVDDSFPCARSRTSSSRR